MLAIVLFVGQEYPGSHVTHAWARDCPAAVIPYVPTQIIEDNWMKKKRFERPMIRINEKIQCEDV